MIRKEAWPFYITSSGLRLCWELEEPKGPKGAQGEAASVRALSGWVGRKLAPSSALNFATSAAVDTGVTPN